MSSAKKQLHRLKTWPRYFRAIMSGEKTFEIRKNDRDFQLGDVLHLEEFDPDIDAYTGEATYVIVRYITDFEQKEGFVVMGIET